MDSGFQEDPIAELYTRTISRPMNRYAALAFKVVLTYLPARLAR